MYYDGDVNRSEWSANIGVTVCVRCDFDGFDELPHTHKLQWTWISLVSSLPFFCVDDFCEREEEKNVTVPDYNIRLHKSRFDFSGGSLRWMNHCKHEAPPPTILDIRMKQEFSLEYSDDRDFDDRHKFVNDERRQQVSQRFDEEGKAAEMNVVDQSWIDKIPKMNMIFIVADLVQPQPNSW